MNIIQHDKIMYELSAKNARCTQSIQISRFSFLTESTNKGVNYRSKDVTQAQQRPDSLTVAIAWHACKYKVQNTGEI